MITPLRTFVLFIVIQLLVLSQVFAENPSYKEKNQDAYFWGALLATSLVGVTIASFYCINRRNEEMVVIRQPIKVPAQAINEPGLTANQALKKDHDIWYDISDTVQSYNAEKLLGTRLVEQGLDTFKDLANSGNPAANEFASSTFKKLDSLSETLSGKLVDGSDTLIDEAKNTVASYNSKNLTDNAIKYTTALVTGIGLTYAIITYMPTIGFAP